MSQLQNKNVRKLKNIVHRAVHFPMGTSKVCNKISIIIIIIIVPLQANVLERTLVTRLSIEYTV